MQKSKASEVPRHLKPLLSQLWPSASAQSNSRTPDMPKYQSAATAPCIYKVLIKPYQLLYGQKKKQYTILWPWSLWLPSSQTAKHCRSSVLTKAVKSLVPRSLLNRTKGASACAHIHKSFIKCLCWTTLATWNICQVSPRKLCRNRA